MPKGNTTLIKPPPSEPEKSNPQQLQTDKVSS